MSKYLPFKVYLDTEIDREREHVNKIIRLFQPKINACGIELYLEKATSGFLNRSQ